MFFTFQQQISILKLNQNITSEMMELHSASPGPQTRKNRIKDEEEKYMEIGATNRARVVRNNLYMVTFLNLLTVLMFIFSMTYYKWIEVQFQAAKKQSKSVWTNLLYAYDEQNQTYISFYDFSRKVCQEDQGLCVTFLEQLSFIGTFCIFIFAVAHIIQIVDISVVLWRICTKRTLSSSNLFRQVFVICTCVYGIALDTFSIAVINNINASNYGISLYLSMGSVVLLIAVVVYEQYSIRKMIKAELILELLAGQKQLNDQRTSQGSKNRNSDSFIL